MFSRFFIDRPVFACVLSILILLAGSVAIFVLPIDRYPQITPPTIQISATYPGADAQTAAESVAAPIEQQLSGVKHLLYFSSLCSNNGSVKIVATFEIGTDQDMAAVEVQNRLSIAEPRLPSEVVRQGITVTKSSTSMLGVVSLESDGRYDDIFLSNYATINLLDTLKRVPGVGDVAVFGTKDYSMRVWVNPDQLAMRGLTVSEVAEAIRASLIHARLHPEDAWPWITSHAQELSPEVIRAHIEMFVTDFSMDLREEGKAAVTRLLEAAARVEGTRLPESDMFNEA
ncbi:efflux RND transporter permease subunit [Desulfocurvibacter africanus]|uniref:efflux RND transporter permease subunit n=1 Tax=Desulfocurvibacter africanus TaxID=873 RepID=UPI002FDA7D4A